MGALDAFKKIQEDLKAKKEIPIESYCFLRTGRMASKIKPGGVQ